MELGAEVNIWYRSPQVGAEVIPCRSYSCRTSIAPFYILIAKQVQVYVGDIFLYISHISIGHQHYDMSDFFNTGSIK